MKRAISVGKGFGKKDLHEAITQSQVGDVIVLDPGVYDFPNGYVINNLRMVGNGAKPTDVQLNGYFSTKKGGVLQLENLIFNCQSPKQNTIYLRPQSSLVLTKVIVDSTIEKYPPVFANNANVKITASEIRWSKYHDTSALYVNASSYAIVSKSIINGLYIGKQSTCEVQESQVIYFANIQHGSTLTADALYLDRLFDGDSLTIDDGSQVKTDQIDFPDGQYAALVTHSLFKCGQNNLDDQHQLTIQMDEQSTVDVQNAVVNIIRPTQTSPDPMPTQKKQPEKDASPKPKPEKAQNQQTASKGPSALEQLNAMVGLGDVKAAVTKFINLAVFNQKRKAKNLPTISQSYHSIYLGNPGTGKTTVARLVAKIMYEKGVMPKDKYVEVSRQNLVSPNVGGTAVQTKKVLESALGGVLFIDEAYSLYQKGGSVNWGQEAVDTILKFMEDHRADLMIIFAGYTKEMDDFIAMNPGLKSRAPNVFKFEDYTPQEISTIGVKLLHDKKFSLNDHLYDQIVQSAYENSVDGGNGRWVRNFNDKLLRIVADHCVADTNRDMTKILDSDIQELAGGTEEMKQNNVKHLLSELDAMVGLDNVKSFVHDLVNRATVDKKLADKLPSKEKPTYHMVFTGNPGTGKTTIARLIAQIFYNLGILQKDTVSEVSRSDLVGEYIGHTEAKTRKVVRNAMGGVLFVDEAYQLTANYDQDFGHQAVETLLTELENNRDKFIAIFAGYTDEMTTFLSSNPGLRSRIPLTIHFDDYTPAEVAEIVCRRVASDWVVNENLLKHLVASKYQSLPDNEKSNGRWARNYVDQLINHQKSWLVYHMDADDVTRIPDELVMQSPQW